jgi:hypothetical protein
MWSDCLGLGVGGVSLHGLLALSVVERVAAIFLVVQFPREM